MHLERIEFVKKMPCFITVISGTVYLGAAEKYLKPKKIIFTVILYYNFIYLSNIYSCHRKQVSGVILLKYEKHEIIWASTQDFDTSHNNIYIYMICVKSQYGILTSVLIRASAVSSLT